MQKHFLTVILVMVLSLSSIPSEAEGKTYYVDPSGSNETGDGSLSNPWRTIQHSAEQVAAGDTVLINPGTYEGGIVVESGGTASEPITFRGNGVGTVIEGSGGELDAFFINSADYIVLENLAIQNSDRYGLVIFFSNHVVVRNCSFADSGRSGVLISFSDYSQIEDCESYGALEEHGIYISNSSDYPIIRENRIHHNRSCGLHMNGDVISGGDGIISYGQIDNNIIYENGFGGGSAINMDGVTDTFIRNNLLYNNHAFGISLYQIDGGSGSRNNWVLNNTIIVAVDGRWAINIANLNDNADNKVYNNILFNYHGWRGSIQIAGPTLEGFESDYNVVMNLFSDDGGTLLSLVEWQALGYDNHSIIATPEQLFVNPTNYDFHLVSHSPGIDAGNNAVANLPAQDFENDERRVDDPMTQDTGNGPPPIIDIGADEFMRLSSCTGDFHSDGDVDGLDLAIYASGTIIDPEGFANDFGRNDCFE